MAGVLEQIIRSRRKLVSNRASTVKIDQNVLELHAAIEILAEVFGTNVSEIEEMLKQRYQEGTEARTPHSRRTQGQPLLRHRCSEATEWPLEFCIVE